MTGVFVTGIIGLIANTVAGAHMITIGAVHARCAGHCRRARFPTPSRMTFAHHQYFVGFRYGRAWCTMPAATIGQTGLTSDKCTRRTFCLTRLTKVTISTGARQEWTLPVAVVQRATTTISPW